MRSHPGAGTVLPVAMYLCLAPMCLAATIPSSCGSIYKSFAQCLLSLGDSLVGTSKDQTTQNIDTVCRSWDDFHVCASAALAGCPGDAAVVWDSLRQDSRKTQFSGNLYDMCASRITLAPSTIASSVPAAQSPPTSDQNKQETLKGHTHHHRPAFTTLFLPACTSLLFLLRI